MPCVQRMQAEGLTLRALFWVEWTPADPVTHPCIYLSLLNRSTLSARFDRLGVKQQSGGFASACRSATPPLFFLNFVLYAQTEPDMTSACHFTPILSTMLSLVKPFN